MDVWIELCWCFFGKCDIFEYLLNHVPLHTLNNALNTFYLRLYGVRHMVKDHSDSEKGNPLLPHRLLFPISSKGSFVLLYAPSHRQDSTYHGLCYTSCGALVGTRNSSMGSPHEGSILKVKCTSLWYWKLSMEIFYWLFSMIMHIFSIFEFKKIKF